MANEIFLHLCDYSFMHSSFFLTDAIIAGIKNELTTIGEYLDSRLQECTHSFESGTQPGYKDEKKQDSPAMKKYGIIDTKIWNPESIISKELFDPKK